MTVADPYYVLASPERVGRRVVANQMGTADGRGVEAVVYSAFGLRVRVGDDRVEVTLLVPGPVHVPPALGTDRAAVEDVVERALACARALLPERYVRWHAERSAQEDEPMHEAPDVADVDEVLALLCERFGDVMSDVHVRRGTSEGDEVAVRLYDRFDVRTGLARPRGNFFRALPVPVPDGGYLHTLPGEGMGPGTTPGSVRRAYRVLDEYCRARLDLPPRADDEEIP